MNGEGVAQNYVKARQWLEEAKRSPKAQKLLQQLEEREKEANKK